MTELMADDVMITCDESQLYWLLYVYDELLCVNTGATENKKR